MTFNRIIWPCLLALVCIFGSNPTIAAEGKLSDELNFAWNLEKQGYRVLALKAYDRIRRNAPNNFEAHDGYKRAMGSLGRGREVTREYEHMAAADPGNALLKAILGELYLHDISKSKRILREALELDPVSVPARTTLALLLIYDVAGSSRKGRMKESRDLLEDIIEQDPNAARAQIVYGLALAEDGNVEKAMEVTKKATVHPIRSVWAYSMLGKYYLDKGDEKTGREYLLEARKRNPNHILSYRWMADFLAGKGRTKDAVIEYRKALSVHFGDAAVYNNFAWLLSTAESLEADPREAIALAEQAVEMSERQLPEYLDTLAEAYFRSGNLRAAIEAAKEALQLQPRDTSYYKQQLKRFSEAVK